MVPIWTAEVQQYRKKSVFWASLAFTDWVLMLHTSVTPPHLPLETFLGSQARQVHLPRCSCHRRGISVPRTPQEGGRQAGLGCILGLLCKHQAILFYNKLETLETFIRNGTNVTFMLHILIIYTEISLKQTVSYFSFKSFPAPQTWGAGLYPGLAGTRGKIPLTVFAWFCPVLHSQPHVPKPNKHPH